MAAFLRSSWRAVHGRGRRQASSFAQQLQAEEEHAVGTTNMWRKISLFVALPGIAIVTWNAIQKEREHHQHIVEHGRPPFVPYTHLRLRYKPFPWGDGNHSLIHNKHTNALPEGYEDE